MKKGTNVSTKETNHNEVIGGRADAAEVKKYKEKATGKKHTADTNDTEAKRSATAKK